MIERTDQDARPPLPTFPGRHDRERALLGASRAVVDLYLRSGTADIPIRVLAEGAGLSERTFYRYFPRKEDAIRPYVEAGLAHVVERVRAAPGDRPLRDALVDAHADFLGAARAADGAAFLAVVSGDPRLRAVWLQVLTDAEEAFTQVIAARLGLEPDGLRARLAGAAVVTAGRLALSPATAPGPGRDPVRVFAASLDLLGAALFAAAPDGPHQRSTP